MFRSAVLKLTAWYLSIVIAISVTFSAVIFHVSYSEVGLRLDNYRTAIVEGSQLPLDIADALLKNQSDQAAIQLFLMLVYFNAVIVILGGIGSYFLARRTLDPIEEAHISQARFTSDVSHELKTPLAILRTELEVALRSNNMKKDDYRKLLESNLDEVNKLTHLTEMLLKLSRLDNESLEMERIDLVKLAQQSISRLKIEDLVKLDSPKKLIVKANPGAISEVIYILLDNAVKYRTGDKQINLSISKHQQNASLSVINVGPKITTVDLDKIFDRFYQVEKSRSKSSQEGYGLGLSIAKKLIHLHKGEIKAKSAKGKNIFTVSLPISTHKDLSKLQQKS